MSRATAAMTGLAAYSSESLLGQAPETKQGGSPHSSGLEQEILELFADMPDRKSVKILGQAVGAAPRLIAQLNPGQRMFVASTMKSVILCERLRQLDSPDIEEEIAEHKLALNESIWSPGSVIFNPPDLSGLVSERTTMEAMIVHSDNTATDMILKQAGPSAARSFMASIGLKNSQIPDSTRIFAAYLFGLPNYKTATWDDLERLPPGLPVHPFLNDVETLASSAEDLVSFFSRALQGNFFLNPQTLFQFRRILSLGDINYLVPFPIGLSVFGKAGYADVPGMHARSIAGGVYFPNHWVYFSMILNWDAQEDNDPETVTAFYTAIRKSIELLREQLGDCH